MRIYRLLQGCLLLGLLLACDENADPSPVEKPPIELDEIAPSYFGNFVQPLDNQVSNAGVELGRFLFYDKRLSGDNSVSCASCHQQAKAFTDGLPVSRGVQGRQVDKNAMSLANLLWINRFFWDGRSSSLEGQALVPITNPLEMDQDLDQLVSELNAVALYPPKFQQAFGTPEITADRIAKALAQFQRTLISANSKYDQHLRGDYILTAEEKKGMDLFFTHPVPQIGLRGGNCGDCHVGPLTAGDRNAFVGFHNNGLDADAQLKAGLQAVTGNANDRGKFRAPALRNIALTAPYMHDGRFQTLEEVLEHYDQHVQRSTTLDPLIIEASNEVPFPGDPIKLYLTSDEKKAILAFLQLLTDQDFVTNPDFSDPFVE